MSAVFKKIPFEANHGLMLGDVLELTNPDWGKWVVVEIEPDMTRPWRVIELGTPDDEDAEKGLSPTCDIVTLRRVKL